jgi:hypothetical protein
MGLGLKKLICPTLLVVPFLNVLDLLVFIRPRKGGDEFEVIAVKIEN